MKRWDLAKHFRKHQEVCWDKSVHKFTFYKRIQNHWWSIKNAINTPSKGQWWIRNFKFKKEHEFYYQEKREINYSTFMYRIRKGMLMQEAIDKPIARYTKRVKESKQDPTYDSRNENRYVDPYDW